jgi:cellulose synthase/poly-beta-1,6-N-acetylglucosamine synthase-like glycosyltransferase
LEWFDGHLVSTLNLAAQREVLTELEGLASWSAGEDIDLWMSALDLGFEVVAHNPNMIVWHQQRTSLGRLIKQHWGYALAVPRLFKKHFPKTTVVATSRKRLLHARFFTSLIVINPHTVLLLLFLFLGWKASLVYLFFLALKPVHFFIRSRRVGLPLAVWQCAAISLPDEMLRWVVNWASLVGSVRNRVFCIR